MNKQGKKKFESLIGKIKEKIVTKIKETTKKKLLESLAKIKIGIPPVNKQQPPSEEIKKSPKRKKQAKRSSTQELNFSPMFDLPSAQKSTNKKKGLSKLQSIYSN
mmetsp:Transcript_20048/g.30819  ORF Transcript_20048/g.30819 Transcript_20048/m.30819 type:complete len:105 (+) Transcript_20048:247-561(+)